MRVKVISRDWTAECEGKIKMGKRGKGHLAFTGIVIDRKFPMMHCPFHDDEHPSLLVEQSGGVLILMCLAGCHPVNMAKVLRDILKEHQRTK